MLGWLSAICVLAAAVPIPVAKPCFGIQIIDRATGRGVPLVELRTVNDISFFTDSSGWIAFHEPGLMDREVYFSIASPGYERAKDGFGFRGIKARTVPGQSLRVMIDRTNIASRVCRLTGQGIDGHRELLGLPASPKRSAFNVGVMGQDSVQVVPYRGKLFWLWGDTNLPQYPLGQFQTSAATSRLKHNPEDGIAYDYFTDAKFPDRVRAMVPLNAPGPVWLFGLLTVPDNQGRERLISHFTRRKSLAEQAEHGLVAFDDDLGVFRVIVKLEESNTWKFPRGNAVRDGEYWYFASPFCHTRVKADWDSIRDPNAYEAYAIDPVTKQFAWQKDRPPSSQPLVDAESGKPVTIHTASINWNAYRKRWTMIGVESNATGKPSALGEVWYAESATIVGPWSKAIRIATHPNYTFYNPRQHPFLDEAGGRIIYFEGTYTNTFSSNKTPTPRYEYNQLLYKLELSDPRLSHSQRSTRN